MLENAKYHKRLRVDADGGPEATRAARRRHREHKLHRVVVWHIVGLQRVRAARSRAAGRCRVREVRTACSSPEKLDDRIAQVRMDELAH